ncbi:MAG: hypothetical protein WA304_10565 [Candidatus Cybelea sp.]
MATADFEASMKEGSKLRIELARIVFELERQQNEYFASIAGDAERLLDQSNSFLNEGTFMYRVYDPEGTTIGRHDVNIAAAELACFIQDHVQLRADPRRLLPVDDGERYPSLNRLGVYVFCADDEGPTHVMWDPLLEPLDPDAAIEVFDRVRIEKARKFPGYSDNGALPVWLVFGVQSLKQRYLPLSTVNALSHVDTVDPRPFARILVGCYTAGVTFIKPYQRPRYTSLSTTG